MVVVKMVMLRVVLMGNAHGVGIVTTFLPISGNCTPLLLLLPLLPCPDQLALKAQYLFSQSLGAFLIPYIMMLLLGALPLFYMVRRSLNQ